MSHSGKHEVGLHYQGVTGVFMDDGQIHHLPISLQIPLLDVAHSLGLPSSVVVFILLQILSLPAGLFHRQISSVPLRHMYSTVLGTLYLWLVFGWSSIFLLGLAACIYALVPVLPKCKTHAIVFGLSMSYLAVVHVYFMMMHFGIWAIDISAPLMVTVIKLITFAINWEDGNRLRNKERLHSNDRLHTFYCNHALERYPSPLEFASFITFYSGVLAGPVFGIREYLSFQDHSVFRQAGLSACPNPVIPMLKTLGYSVICYGGVFISGYFPLIDYVDGDEFLFTTSFLYRLAYLVFGVAFFRAKYYFTWYLGEAGCISSGFGFAGVNAGGNYRWDAMNNVRVLDIEFGTHVSDLTDSWNRRVSNFLKYYVYFRVKAPKSITSIFGGERHFAMLVTRVTSAFWHGFYPSYYFFFISVMFLNEVSSELRRRVEPRLDQMKPSIFQKAVVSTYLLICKFFTFICMNYFGVAFSILHSSKLYKIWSRVYFAGHMACIAIVLMLKLIPVTKKASVKRSDKIE